jgi:hypothetical protein
MFGEQERHVKDLDKLAAYTVRMDLHSLNADTLQKDKLQLMLDVK